MFTVSFHCRIHIYLLNNWRIICAYSADETGPSDNGFGKENEVANLLDETFREVILVPALIYAETFRLPDVNWQLTCKKEGSQGMRFSCDAYVRGLKLIIKKKMIVCAIKPVKFLSLY